MHLGSMVSEAPGQSWLPPGFEQNITTAGRSERWKTAGHILVDQEAESNTGSQGWICTPIKKGPPPKGPTASQNNITAEEQAFNM